MASTHTTSPVGCQASEKLVLPETNSENEHAAESNGKQQNGSNCENENTKKQEPEKISPQKSKNCPEVNKDDRLKEAVVGDDDSDDAKNGELQEKNSDKKDDQDNTGDIIPALEKNGVSPLKSQKKKPLDQPEVEGPEIKKAKHSVDTVCESETKISCEVSSKGDANCETSD